MVQPGERGASRKLIKKSRSPHGPSNRQQGSSVSRGEVPVTGASARPSAVRQPDSRAPIAEAVRVPTPGTADATRINKTTRTPVALSPHDVERTPAEVLNERPQDARSAAGSGWRARLNQLFDTEAVPHAPAQQFTGGWAEEAAPAICDSWVEAQRRSNPDAISLVALSKMKALDYERKNQDKIQPGDRLLKKENPTNRDYYEAQIVAFLAAVGIEDAALKAVRDSFKEIGTGGLHRQHVTVGATFNTALGAAAQFLAAQDLAAAAVISGVRLVLQGVIAERIWDSGYRRLRNAGTEDILPLGRSDAPPSARTAPTLFQAAHAVIWGLHGAKKNLRKLKAASAELESALGKSEGKNAPQNGRAIEAAREKLDIALARFSHHMAIKAAYKASSESAKIEFRGNQRYLATSYTGTALTLGAGAFSILTPVIGALAAPVTGGISAGVAVLIMALYVGYQLSSGPGKDGEEKAKRAIVALTKSLDVLSGDNTVSQKRRADAYAGYLEKMRAARRKVGAACTEAKTVARNDLLKDLRQIAQDDEVQPVMDSQENWAAYCDYEKRVSNIKEKTTDAQADAEFLQKLQTSLSTEIIANAWKSPVRIRMEIAESLLCGKVAQLTKQLHDLKKSPLLQLRRTGNRGELTEDLRRKLKAALRDTFNLKLALMHMKDVRPSASEAMKSASDTESLKRASAALAAIQDTDVRDVFCGDARRQVEVANKAKKLTAGEAERYVYTNAGASALAVGLNVGVGSVDLGFGAAKAAGAVHVGLYNENPEGLPRIPAVGDYRTAALAQTGAPVAAHLNAGNRAAFQKKQMPRALKITLRPEDAAVEQRLKLSGIRLAHLAIEGEEAQAVNAELDALVRELDDSNTVPDKITLSMTMAHAAPNLPGPSSAPIDDQSINLELRLNTTTAYHQWRYKHEIPLSARAFSVQRRA